MAQELRFGVPMHQDAPWPGILARVGRYEATGLDSIGVADHFVHDADPTGPWLACWTLLAGLAARTSRIRLGPLVSHAIYRNPAVLARQAMTDDRLIRMSLSRGLRHSGLASVDAYQSTRRPTSRWAFSPRWCGRSGIRLFGYDPTAKRMSGGS